MFHPLYKIDAQRALPHTLAREGTEKETKIKSSVEDWSVKSRKWNLPLKKCLEKHNSAFVRSKFNFREMNEQRLDENWTYCSVSSIFPPKIWFSSHFWAIFQGGFKFQLLFFRKTAVDAIFFSCLQNLRSKISFSGTDSKIFHGRNVWKKFIEQLWMERWIEMVFYKGLII